ncbi:MAG: ORF6N domain-containing protein [Oscillospiraceae bacterium]|nr:ORF6N domain-containing protein [Oscillospiraceae bacterium]
MNTDAAHQRPEGTARKRFNDNKKHFVEGEDYFNVQMSEKRTLGFDVPNRGLTLITESGYYMLVKSFTAEFSAFIQNKWILQLTRRFADSDQNREPS